MTGAVNVSRKNLIGFSWSLGEVRTLLNGTLFSNRSFLVVGAKSTKSVFSAFRNALSTLLKELFTTLPREEVIRP